MEKRLLLKNEEYEEREKDRRSKKRVKTRGGVDRPAPPRIEDVDFHPAVASIHRLHFSFRGYCRGAVANAG